MIAGQDVHKPKHLSPLILMTRGDGDDILDDIAAERYECAWGTRVWSLGRALRDGHAARRGDWHPLRRHTPSVRGRIASAMDVALAGYRAAGQVHA